MIPSPAPLDVEIGATEPAVGRTVVSVAEAEGHQTSACTV